MTVVLGRDPEEDRRTALASEQLALDYALAQGAEHANPDWIDYAHHVIRQVALTHRTFIVDAIWDAGLGKPPEARIIGNVLVWARREGLIEATNEFIPSAQTGCHRVPRRVWHSLIFEETT